MRNFIAVFFKRKKSQENEEYIALSEGQLMWRQFLKHRVAVIASIILIFLYSVVIFANFFAGIFISASVIVAGIWNVLVPLNWCHAPEVVSKIFYLIALVL